MQNTIKKVNWNPVSFMNIDIKLLNKIVTCDFQKALRRILRHDQVDCISHIQGLFNMREIT